MICFFVFRRCSKSAKNSGDRNVAWHSDSYLPAGTVSAGLKAAPVAMDCRRSCSVHHRSNTAGSTSFGLSLEIESRASGLHENKLSHNCPAALPRCDSEYPFSEDKNQLLKVT